MSESDRLSFDRREGIAARARVLSYIRQFFDERAFLEIEAPLLVPAPGLEVHLKSLRVKERYLITSPEFQMKRLLVGGLEKIYTVCRCFRDEEEGEHHATEFSMLEWYRARAELGAIQRDTEALVCGIAEAFSEGQPQFTVQGRKIDVSRPWQEISVQDLMRQHAGIELEGDETAAQLRAKLALAGINPGSCVEWDDLFYTAFVERVEPALARHPSALVVSDWPAKLGALAKNKASDPKCVERFEVYVGGLELANAFGELTDATEQVRRFEDDLDYRRRRGFHVPPMDQKFIAALREGMPESAGIALGVDRLAMLAAGASHIRHVQAFAAGEL